MQRILKNNFSLGAILMLHKIDTPDVNGIWYNQHLKLSADSLSQLIEYAEQKGCTFVSLDELYDTMHTGSKRHRLIAITLDDGYRDNFTNGLPVFKQNNVPFCIYVCGKMCDGHMLYWWEILEQLVLQNNAIVLSDGRSFFCRTKDQKEKAFLDIRDVILTLPQNNLQEQLEHLFKYNKLDLNFGNDTLALTWDQVRQLSTEPLCTIGNHTYSHESFSGCSKAKIISDVKRLGDTVYQNCGIRPKHFAYPFGDPIAVAGENMKVVRDMDFMTIATTNSGYVGRNTDPFMLPRLFVTERNWKSIIDNIAGIC